MNKDLPLFSIVTPSYNQGRFIEDTILSVKNQDYPNIEHIIVDGGSTDNTLEILKKYENEYNLRWISEHDDGQSDAVNKGFKMAKGKIIGWLNSDDVYFTRDVISYVVEEFDKNPDTEVIYGDTVIIDDKNFVRAIKCTCPWFSYSRLLRVVFISQPSTFFRKTVIQKHKIDINIDLPMDYEYWLRLASDGFKFKHARKLLSAERWHSSAKTASRFRESKIEIKNIREKYGQKFDFKYHLLRQLDKVSLAITKVFGMLFAVKMLFSSEWDLAFPAKYYPALKILVFTLTSNYL